MERDEPAKNSRFGTPEPPAPRQMGSAVDDLGTCPQSSMARRNRLASENMSTLAKT